MIVSNSRKTGWVLSRVSRVSDCKEKLWNSYRMPLNKKPLRKS